MSEIAVLKANLAGLKKRRKQLLFQAENIHDGICRELNTGLVRIEETDIDRTLALFEDFKNVHTDLAVNASDIARINRKLV